MPNTIGNFSAIQLGDNVYNVSIDKSLKSPKALLTGNLNDYWGANNYGVYYGEDGAANNVSNAPDNLKGAFSLIVTGLDNSRTMQTFIAGYSTKGGVGTITRVFIREHINYGGGSTEWTPWRELINSDGGTIKGTLSLTKQLDFNNTTYSDINRLIIFQNENAIGIDSGANCLTIYSKGSSGERQIVLNGSTGGQRTSLIFNRNTSFPISTARNVASEEWVNDGFLSKSSLSVSGTTLKIS